jgi:WS/DGAT/MGAT family acyltransferase
MLSETRDAASGLWSLLRAGMRPSSPLPFNRLIGPHRRIEWLEVEMADVKKIRETLGGTVNDVVLTTVAGAMGTFLRELGIDVARTPFRAAVPVSVRAADQRGAGGNRVSAWLAELPIAERDAWRRLARVRGVTARLRRDHQATGAQALTEVAEWTGSAALGLALKLISRAAPHNVIVTNVPGPPVSLYLLDARVDSLYPHLPLFENQGLGIALLSYSGTLAWGLAADWELVPRLDLLRDGLAQAFTELLEVAESVARRKATAHAGRVNDRVKLQLARAPQNQLRQER